MNGGREDELTTIKVWNVGAMNGGCSRHECRVLHSRRVSLPLVDNHGRAPDVKPENWPAGYAVLYGGMHGAKEQVFGS